MISVDAVGERLPAILKPVFGALLGLGGYGLMATLPPGAGAAAAVALWTAVSMWRGERGFARWFSPLPLFGTLLAAGTVLARWYALVSLAAGWGRLAIVIGAMALGPAAAVALAWVSRPVDDGAFRGLSRLTTAAALMAIAEGIAASLLCGPRLGTAMALLTWLLVRGIAYFTSWRWGGVRGSDLEGCRVLVETAALAMLAGLTG